MDIKNKIKYIILKYGLFILLWMKKMIALFLFLFYFKINHAFVVWEYFQGRRKFDWTLNNANYN